MIVVQNEWLSQQTSQKPDDLGQSKGNPTLVFLLSFIEQQNHALKEEIF